MKQYSQRVDYGADGLLAAYHAPAGRSVAFSYGPGGYVTSVVPALGPGADYKWHTALGILTNVTIPGPAAPRSFALDRDELGRTRRLTLPWLLGSDLEYRIWLSIEGPTW